MARECYRNIDKPILVLGLEYADWILVMGVFLVVLLLPFVSNLTVLMVTAGAWAMVRVLKTGRPPGYMLHLLYAQGVPFPQLLPPKTTRYSAFPARPSTFVWRKRHGKLP